MPNLKNIVVVQQSGGKDLRSAWDSFVASYAMSKRWYAAGVADSPFMSSGIPSSKFQCSKS